MSMTKKDYEAIGAVAVALKRDISLRRSDDTRQVIVAMNLAQCRTVDAFAADMADAFERMNPEFQRGRFLTACGVQS